MLYAQNSHNTTIVKIAKLTTVLRMHDLESHTGHNLEAKQLSDHTNGKKEPVANHFGYVLRKLLQEVCQLSNIFEEGIFTHKTVVCVVSRLSLLLQTMVTISAKEDAIQIPVKEVRRSMAFVDELNTSGAEVLPLSNHQAS